MENIQNYKTGPKDVFMDILGFGALYAAIVSFLTLIFQYINYVFPDPLTFYEGAVLNSIRISTSILIVILPVFLFISWLAGKEFRAFPIKREAKFRKWLIYFTLFIAAITIIVDLIVLVNEFYSGDLTIQFFLKVAAVLAVGVSVFGYYFWDLKRVSGDVSKKPRQVGWMVAAVVAASIVAGFFVVGSPAEQRDRRFDEQRVQDLQMIQNQIVSYWSKKGILPAKLDNLGDDILGFALPADPQTEEPYGYRVLGFLQFELCAEFKTKSDEKRVSRYPGSFEQWTHDEGRICFARTIDPQLHRIEEVMPKSF